jgi:NAD-dependent deacetylase
LSLLTVPRLTEIISDLERVVVITGAGVSTPSGIPDFVTIDDKWAETIPREIALSINFFTNYPERFWKIFKDLFLLKTRANLQPSNAHVYLKNLEVAAEVEIFTQNVDGLHQLAGSSNVTEIHGNAHSLTCIKCGKKENVWKVYDTDIPVCWLCGGLLKPDIILYGENTLGYTRMIDALDGPGVLLIMGTSLNVAPVNNLPMQAANYFPHLWRIYWDKNASSLNESMFHHHITTDFNDLA